MKPKQYYSGTDAIEFLSGQLNKDESVSSSHWKHFHRNFRLGVDGSLEGLEGFGGVAEPYRGFRKLAHWILQHPYRQTGKKFRDFERLHRIGMDIAEIQGRAYDLDFLRQVLSVAFLREKRLFDQPVENAIVIGDGFAAMATLLLASGFAKRVFLVNLTKTLIVDLVYFDKWARSTQAATFAAVTSNRGIQQAISEECNLVGIQASNQHLISAVKAQIVINIASMQEMNPEIIAQYFKSMRSIQSIPVPYFYCCNRLEKKLPDGKLIRFADYPWSESDTIIADAPCPWHQKYYTLRPPFYHAYNGMHWHRLVQLRAKGSIQHRKK